MDTRERALAVPSPADVVEPEPEYTARQLLEKIVEFGGHIHRMREHAVFVITRNPDLARALFAKGASRFRPKHGIESMAYPLGGYRLSRDPDSPTEWDIYVHTIPVRGEETVWEAAADFQGER